MPALKPRFCHVARPFFFYWKIQAMMNASEIMGLNMTGMFLPLLGTYYQCICAAVIGTPFPAIYLLDYSVVGNQQAPQDLLQACHLRDYHVGNPIYGEYSQNGWSRQEYAD